ncbi:MAG: glycosyltransferase [Parcubacteria group bacterium]|jgi:glycosyltransferase involved in cell wall biosynthesis
MKIAIFSDTFPPQVDGVSSVASQLAESLLDRGNEVLVVTISKNGHRESGRQSPERYEIIHLPSLPAPVYSGYRVTLPIRQASRKLKKFYPDVIHTHTPFSVGWEAVQSAKKLGVPLVGTHHTFYDHYLKHVKVNFQWAKKFTWKIMVNYYNHCDMVLSPTQSLADTLIKYGLKSPSEILSNPVNTDLFDSLSRGEKSEEKKKLGLKGKSFVYMGRVSYEKSIDQVIKAFAIISKKIPDVKLAIIGDGPEKRPLEILADNLGLEERVIFTGFLYGEKLAKTLGANEVFVTASKSENMPISVLEAMAAGLPVIGARALGIPEIIKDNENGFLVPPDNTEEMAEKMMELIGEDALLDRFSSASRNLSMKYAREKIAEKHEKIYQSLIESRL